MTELDDLFNTSDPEVQAAIAVVKRHSKYHEDHPEQCPHNGIVAPIVDGQG